MSSFLAINVDDARTRVAETNLQSKSSIECDAVYSRDHCCAVNGNRIVRNVKLQDFKYQRDHRIFGA
jgi:hypothetical protein